FGDGLARGVMGSYYLRPDAHLGLKYFRSDEISDVFDDYRAHSDLLAITVKEFISNSFYMEGGFGVRKKYVHRKNRDLIIEDSTYWVKHTSDYSRTDAGFLIGIGNQWQWSRFTIGCEWIGAYIPASPTRVNGNKEEIREDGSRRNLSLDRSDRNTETSVRLLNFHLGMVF
ncbi:MAG: hypothetical protein M3Q07_27770, partial [Pseudobdellovibrionaceae bacterium]|nr:hypothetical protein [Pseudobdellovibrionaceae bacterium]